MTLSWTGTSSCGRAVRLDAAQLLTQGRPATGHSCGETLRSLLEPHGHRGAVTREVLGLGERDDVSGHLGQGLARVVDDVHRLEERAHAQAAGVAGAAGGRQHVVGAGAVVAQRHRRPRTDEARHPRW